MKQITEPQFSAACKVASRVYAHQMKSADGVALLVGEHGMNETSALDLIRDYRNLMEGKVIKRGMGAAAMHHFIEQIRLEHGIQGLAHAIAALRAHLEYRPSRTMQDVLAHFEAVATQRHGVAPLGVPNTWLFQANPDSFDVSGYLSLHPAKITWLARQHREEIDVGDTVFLWLAKGSGKVSGVIAECRVAGRVTDRADDPASLPFWKLVPVAGNSEPRVDLLILRIAGDREIIKRDWFQEDPILRHAAIIRQSAGTNFKLNAQQALRLRVLWARAGEDWTWRDSVAGLWAYSKTRGSPISKTPESPVAHVALMIGRSIGGVYNKVMNFRALDPADDRAGLSGAGEVDRRVWAEFFDAARNTVDTNGLAAEMQRLGLEMGGPALPESPVVAVPVARTPGTLDDLMNRYRASLESGAFGRKPRAAVTAVQAFDRNPLVVAVARVRAKLRCEVPGCTTATFLTEASETFCEVHHIMPLAEGGEDVIENAICLCALHHREVHYGAKREVLRDKMVQVRNALKG